MVRVIKNRVRLMALYRFASRAAGLLTYRNRLQRYWSSPLLSIATETHGSWIRTVCIGSSNLMQKDVDSNPFYEKYKDKLEKVRSPSARKVNEIKTKVDKEKRQQQRSSRGSSPHPAAYYSFQSPPSLDSVMHVSMIADKSPEEVTEIWQAYHKTRDCISAVIPADTYVQMHIKGMHSPFFVYPLPRDEGFEFIYAQFSGHHCYFTSLINYQLYQENAPPCLTLTHYTDLQDSKGIVLMAGEVDTKLLSVLEAQFLANQLQLYYAGSDPGRYSLVRQFNLQPQEFDYKQLIEHLENSGIERTKQ